MVNERKIRLSVAVCLLKAHLAYTPYSLYLITTSTAFTMKVYISSTYQDLVEYRAAVDRTLRRMGHDVIGMEQYVAEGSKPVDRCIADVKKCDVYVVIVAWRYGYVPGSTTTLPDKKSITQIELETAKDNEKPVLAFLLDPQAPWPPNHVDAMGGSQGAGEDISRFRDFLGTEYMAGIFRTPDDLASQVAAAISAQGVTQRMINRVLGQTSSARNMDSFARGEQQINDSSLENIRQLVKTAIEQTGAARAMVLEISEGQTWWSTRLFLLASLLRSLTNVRQIVFCNSQGKFAGMASPTAIMEGLTNAFPALDEIARRLRNEPASVDMERETKRQLEVWRSSVYDPTVQGAVKQKLPEEGGEEALKVVVRPALLQDWIGERWISRSIQVDSYDLSMSEIQQIVDSLLPDVPLERPRKKPDTGFELMVVARDVFALELAREWVRSGLARSPVRL